MIYEFRRTIVHWCKSIRHFFRAMFCKNVGYESHGIRVCTERPWQGARNRGYCVCRYNECPKRKEVDAEWNCATCKHMWSKTEADTLECISCNEGDKYVEYMKGADDE